MHDTLHKTSHDTTKNHTPDSSAKALSVWHRWGGYTGLIPFIGLSALSIAGYEQAQPALISYAALIFSFLCGVIWFVSLRRPQTGHIAVVALGGMLWSWCWLLFPALNWSAAAGISFVLLWLYERATLRKDYGEAFFKLRLQLSSGAAISLLLAYLLA